MNPKTATGARKEPTFEEAKARVLKSQPALAKRFARLLDIQAPGGADSGRMAGPAEQQNTQKIA